jgi:hypothetical protein
MLLLGYIQSDENFAILIHGSLSVCEDRLGQSEQPSLMTRKGGPPISQTEYDV